MLKLLQYAVTRSHMSHCLLSVFFFGFSVFFFSLQLSALGELSINKNNNAIRTYVHPRTTTKMETLFGIGVGENETKDFCVTATNAHAHAAARRRKSGRAERAFVFQFIAVVHRFLPLNVLYIHSCNTVKQCSPTN